MAQVFRIACRDAHTRAGAWGVLLLWLPILGDLLVSAVGERVAALRGVWEGETIVVIEGNARRGMFRWWVVAVAVGIFITLPIGRTIGPGNMSTGTWRTFFVVVAAVCGSLYGAFLGRTLVVLLRPRPGAIPL